MALVGGAGWIGGGIMWAKQQLVGSKGYLIETKQRK